MDILSILFNMSITGSIIFLIFLFMKPITKKYFNSSWHYKMLVLTLIFFIIPMVGFVEIPIGLLPSIPKVEMQESKGTDNIIKVEEIKDMEKTGNVKEERNKDEIKTEIKDEKPSTIETKNNIPNDIKFSIHHYIDTIKYLWIIGMLVLFLIKIVPYIRFKSNIIRNSLEVTDEATLQIFNGCKNELNIENKLPLRTCDTIGSPMLIGVFHPIVLIPSIDNNDKRLKMIFLHELNHYKRKDIITKAFGLIINAIHWINPIIYILLKEIDKYCEYSIDEKVVDEMNMEERKYYGETILTLIDKSFIIKSPLTTAMGSNGKELKSRLKNMIYSFKTSRKRYIIALFVSALIITSGLTVACSIIPNETAKENDSYAVYIKDDGLYYSDLDGKKETKVHDGNGFEYPLISKSGSFIAYTKDDSLYIYNTKDKTYEKIAEEIQHYYALYDWIDDNNIVYSTDEPGFTIYNLATNEKKEHLDEYYYDNFKAANKNILYAKKIKQWTTEEGSFASTLGIVEIDLDNYHKKDKRYEMETIIEGKESTDTMLGYNPTISKITDDGRYLFIMEKFASGSTSADYAGIGLYDTVEKVHIDYTDIYDAQDFTYGEEDKDLAVLPFVNNITINPKSNNFIGVIKGGFRERFMNKEVVLLNIHEDKTYDITNFMEKDLVAMTPSFTLDGEKLLYSATKAIDPYVITDYNEAYRIWKDQPHNIYEYDLKNSQTRKLTEGSNFDFMPINIYKDEIIFCRVKNNGYSSLIRLSNGKEEILVDDIIIDYVSETSMDVFINNNNGKNKGNSRDNKNLNSLKPKLSESNPFITDETEKSNKEVAKIIKEEIGIDVDVKEGILSYDPEKAFSERNNEVEKIIKEVYGITVETKDGILEIDPKEAQTNSKYKLSGSSFETIIKPDALLSDYPYDSGQIRGESYSYTKYLFKFNTEFSSHGKNLYHVDFYSQNDSYMFTISGSNVDNIYYTSVNINYGDNLNSYYAIMYNDDKISTTNLDINYFIHNLSAIKVYDKINSYLEEESKNTFSPYYELLDFKITNYQEKVVNEGVEAVFNYKIIYKNYDKDPDTVGYIKEAKEKGNKNYQQMYDEYLEPKEMNFDLKVVIDKDDKTTLYSNISPKRIEWDETKMSDFILSK